jgi:hypothetical protein
MVLRISGTLGGVAGKLAAWITRCAGRKSEGIARPLPAAAKEDLWTCCKSRPCRLHLITAVNSRSANLLPWMLSLPPQIRCQISNRRSPHFPGLLVGVTH